MTDGSETPELARSANQLEIVPETQEIVPETPASTAQPNSSTPTEQSSPAKETRQLTNQVLVNFLKGQKYTTQEGESLTLDQQEFNNKVDEFIEQLNKQVEQSISLENFIQALNFGYQRALPEEIRQIESLINKTQEEYNNPQTSEEQKKELQQKIDLLTQMKEEREKLLQNQSQIPEEVKNQIEMVFNKLSPELTLQLITALNNGSFDEVMDVFVNEVTREEEGDSKEIQQTKTKARNAAEWVKRNAPTIGGAVGILLLLIILKSVKQGGGDNNMMR